MRRLVAAGAAALVLALAGVQAASAHHENDTDRPHWPTTTVAVNGGACSVPGCRWLRIWDRTGYTGQSWATDDRPAVISKLKALFPASVPVQVSVAVGSRFDLERIVPGQPTPCPGPCEQTLHYNEALDLTPIGTIFLGRGYRAVSANCAFLPTPWPSYCQDAGNHRLKCVVGAGFSSGDRRTTSIHELGHCMGFSHPPQIPCPANWIMCAAGGWAWTDHERAVIADWYIPLAHPH